MFAVRDNQGRVVRRFHTEAEARVFVRSAKSPVNSRTIKGAEQIVKAALEKNVIMTVKAPSGDTYTAGPYTPAVRTPTGHGYVAYGYGRSRFLRPEFRGSAWEVARFLVEYCGRGNALEAARKATSKNIDHEALLASGSQERMRRAREHIMHNRNPWAKSPRLPKAKIDAAVEAARMYAGSDGLPIKTRQRFYTKLMHHCAAVAKATGNTEANVFEQITARAQSLGRVYPRPGKDY